ncbi:hypothetical protein [Parendozoicomonas haliclonae]|uniref:Helix-turn-helix domain-containing protein n=1 Tax=Parendozoicomonas haliclonae TaxID=1960125 RepID=A0A1X7AFP3_9GAMM|nr:hypothetical protein [Parendozoicomonas haliclonae]SMA36376.1 hypothetical protein EHSB41UT_00633 [Parendozoicomonas haliclonae]
MKKNKKKYLRNIVIRFYPALVKITGSINAALVLAQIDYWWDRRHGKYFYKKDRELAAELGMGLTAFRAAKKQLVKRKLVTTIKRGIPQTTHYQLKCRIEDLIPKVPKPEADEPETDEPEVVQNDDSKSPKKASTDRSNSSIKNTRFGQTNSCITTESTSETTADITSASREVKKLTAVQQSMLKRFLKHWQQTVDKNDCYLPLCWHAASPELDKRIVAAIERMGGVDELLDDLKARCEKVAEECIWLEYEAKEVNLTFLITNQEREFAETQEMEQNDKTRSVNEIPGLEELRARSQQQAQVIAEEKSKIECDKDYGCDG